MTIHHLVVQSPGLTVEHAEQLAALAQAQGVARISATAARLLDVQHDDATRADVVAWAERHGIDTAFVPAGLKLSHCKVLAMDMDSTLINIECIDEIAGVAGVKDKVSEITEAAMRGEIKDFAESLRRRVALLKDVPAEALEQVYTEKLRLNPGAERLITTAQAAGIKVLLVSGGFTFFAHVVRDRLGIDFVRANVLEIASGPNCGELTGRMVDQPWGDICDGAEKRRTLLEVASLLGIEPRQCIAMGDGANDLPMMGVAGLSVAYHAKPAVREQAMVSIEQGGLDRLLEVLR